MTSSYEALSTFIDLTPIFSTHEHHREDELYAQLDLSTLFSWSYVGWSGAVPAGDSTAVERQHWINSMKMNSYYVWLEKAICTIYGEEEITAANWDSLSERIRKAHQDPNYHLQLLRKYAGYQGFLEDAFWNTGTDLGHPDFVTPVYRIDMWIIGYHPDSLDNDGWNPYRIYGEKITDFNTYEQLFTDELRRRRPSVAALKCSVAYFRNLRFDEAHRDEAAAVFGREKSSLTEGERNAFGNYMFRLAASVAGELDLPIQLHTGLAQLSGSSPMLLESVLRDYPGTRFVLFHGGFPWIYETAALAHNYPNVYLDINWLPLISTTAACQALHVYMEVLPRWDKIAWGGDNWTSEESVGASMAFRFILKKVLAEKVDDGFLRLKDAQQFAERIMYRNAHSIYHIPLANEDIE
ncbi:amidohydrolase family protein [Paenibacillus roseipurpureus]|uniref:Amidohydrolase family protein n=1 Tax=Paenibacillus roseopurpureus TaxID=2918901 RepID=A0AA96LQ80_9BACL|nr:amidohydrolase family protein [Paenibacillus sp. MBLB1832]WNR46262.1 amidohydrolase family protein [Paenibacillus sp. MBLB1832]